jgi:hypothetical protein
MAYQMSADELERKWGSRPNGHPIFGKRVHCGCLATGRTTEKNYWQWLSDRSGSPAWTPEEGWLV